MWTRRTSTPTARRVIVLFLVPEGGWRSGGLYLGAMKESCVELHGELVVLTLIRYVLDDGQNIVFAREQRPCVEELEC